MEILIIKNNKTLVNLEFKSLNQKYKENMDLINSKLNSDTKLKKIIVMTLGSVMFVNSVVNAAGPMDKVNVAGSTILGIARTICYWLCLIGCVMEIMKSVMQGDTKGIAKIMMKYGLAFASLYMFPWLLDLIKSIFQ